MIHQLDMIQYYRYDSLARYDVAGVVCLKLVVVTSSRPEVAKCPDDDDARLGDRKLEFEVT